MPPVFFQAVFDAVFDERLQNHAGKEHAVVSIFRQFLDEGKPLAEAHFHDVDKVVNEGQFLFKACRCSLLLYVVAEEVCNLFDEVAGLVSAFHHGELGTGVQCIKEEVRVDLVLQDPELGGRVEFPHFQFLFLHFIFLCNLLPNFVDVRLDADNHPVECTADISHFIFRLAVEQRNFKVHNCNPHGDFRDVGQRLHDDGERQVENDKDKDGKDKDDCRTEAEEFVEACLVCPVEGGILFHEQGIQFFRLLLQQAVAFQAGCIVFLCPFKVLCPLCSDRCPAV